MRPPYLTAHYDDLSADQLARLRHRLQCRILKQSSGCWDAQGAPVHSGHLQLSDGSPVSPPWIRVRAHVFAWECEHQQSVPAGNVVMHICDNPRCVNPAHLSVGTQGDNIRDSIHKGRYNAFGRQKLNAANVREIRKRAAAGERHLDIANDFGIARHTVGGIANRKSWDHLDPLGEVR